MNEQNILRGIRFCKASGKKIPPGGHSPSPPAENTTGCRLVISRVRCYIINNVRINQPQTEKMKRGMPQMKKSVLSLALCLTAAVSFAAFQFEYSPTGTYVDGMPEYTLKVLEGSGHIYTFRGSSPTFSNATVGWYDLDQGYSPGVNEAARVQLEDGNYAYDLGYFTAGDEVGFWMDANGWTYKGVGTSTGVSETGTDHTTLIGRADIDLENRVWGIYTAAGMFTYHDVIQGSGPVIETHTENISFGFFSVEGGAPSGQPLPGVLATLLLGGAAAGWTKLRRKAA